MTKFMQLRKGLIERILKGDGRASHIQRERAFKNEGLTGQLSKLIDNVVQNAYKVSDEDIIAVLESGLSEDQIFELVVCAAVGQATRQHDAALAALAEATVDRKEGEYAS